MALAQDGQVLGELILGPSVTHSRRLLPALDFLLAQTGRAKKDLEGLAVTLGPGYFTGLRIGVATAQGLALGLNLPAWGMSSLRLLAEAAAVGDGTVWAVADARRELVYAACFQRGPGGLERILEDCAISPARLAGMLHPPALLLGDGARLYAEQLIVPGLTLAPAWAEVTRPGILALRGEERLEKGESLSPEKLTPRYCRPSEAEIRFGLPLDEYRLLK